MLSRSIKRTINTIKWMQMNLCAAGSGTPGATDSQSVVGVWQVFVCGCRRCISIVCPFAQRWKLRGRRECHPLAQWDSGSGGASGPPWQRSLMICLKGGPLLRGGRAPTEKGEANKLSQVCSGRDEKGGGCPKQPPRHSRRERCPSQP